MARLLVAELCAVVVVLLCAGVHAVALNEAEPAQPAAADLSEILNQDESEKDPSPFVASPLDLLRRHSRDVTLDTLYDAYVESKQNEQRLVDRVEALSSQVTTLTNQLIGFFSAAKQTNSSEELSGSDQVNRLEIAATGGVTFTRWGRTRCDSDATVLYKGYAAGPRYGEAGGGSDLLCLHEDPQWYRIITAVAGYSNAFSTTYQDVSGMFDTINNGYLPLDQRMIPCAVCHVQTRSHQIMIPARRECPAGWTRGYWGYLLSARTNHPKGMYTCVDEAPESAGVSTDNNNLLYPVEARTPGLKAPPFINGAEITCVVCTK